MKFRDRHDAGRRLGELLAPLAGGDTIVLALPRGGVPVGYEVAQALKAPLDVFVVRKLGTPGQEELAMGAIASGGTRVINTEVTSLLGITPETIDAVTRLELEELHRREVKYRGKRPLPSLAGRTVILVDDGLATGSTMRAAIRALRSHAPARIIVAVPVASATVRDDFRTEADAIYCVMTPEPMHAVGAWYDDFEQTSDEEVAELLRRGAAEWTPSSQS